MIITKFDVANAVKKYYKENTCCFIPAEKITFGDLEKVSKYLACGIPKEKIVAVMDVSFFKTCKKGLVLTADKLYFSSKYYIVGEKGKYCIDFSDLCNVEHNRNGNYNVVTFFFNNKKEIDFYAGLESKDVYDVFITLVLRKKAEKERFNDFLKQDTTINNVNPLNKPADYIPPPKPIPVAVKKTDEEYFYDMEVKIEPYVIDEKEENTLFNPPFMKVFRFNDFFYVATCREYCKLKDYSTAYDYTLINLISAEVSQLLVKRHVNEQCHYYNTPQKGYELDYGLIEGKRVYIHEYMRFINPEPSEVRVCTSLGSTNIIDLKTGETAKIYNTEILDHRVKIPKEGESIVAVKYNGNYYMIYNIESERDKIRLQKIFE